MSIESKLRHTELRSRVRQRIENGRLPMMVPESILGGYGSGQLCVACDQPITNTQVEFAVAQSRDRARFCFHLGCHAVWRAECEAARQGSQL